MRSAHSARTHTQAQQGAFQLGNSYLSLLTDPFATNRVGTTGPLGFAPERQSLLPASIASAYAKYAKAPALAVYEPRWDVWGAAFGGTNNTRGDTRGRWQPRCLYPRRRRRRRCRLSLAPGSLIGFSLAGGNINWSVTGNGFGGNGGGNSDAFMAGIYGKYTAGAGYVSGAVTYSNYWMSTNRTVAVPGLTSSRPTSMRELGRAAGRRLSPTDAVTSRWRGRRMPRSRARASTRPTTVKSPPSAPTSSRSTSPARNATAYPRRARPAHRQGDSRRQWQAAQPVRQGRLCL